MTACKRTRTISGGLEDCQEPNGMVRIVFASCNADKED